MKKSITTIALCLLFSVSAFSQKKDTVSAAIFTQMPIEKSTVQYNGYVVIKNKDTTFLNQDKKRISSQIVQYYSINNKIIWVRKPH